MIRGANRNDVARATGFVHAQDRFFQLLGTPAEHKKLASAFMKANGYTFPVAIDPEGVAVQAHGVESYPTVYVIDKTGKIRFRNLGYTDGIGEIMAAQIDALLAEK